MHRVKVEMPSKLNHHQHIQQPQLGIPDGMAAPGMGVVSPLTAQQQLQWLQAQRMMTQSERGALPTLQPQSPPPPSQSTWTSYCNIL